MTKLSTDEHFASDSFGNQKQTAPTREANLQAANAPENVMQPVAIPSSKHDEFAKELGFESYLALFETSTPISTSREGQWLVTTLQGKSWIVWNAADLTLSGSFDSESAAQSSLPPVSAP